MYFGSLFRPKKPKVGNFVVWHSVRLRAETNNIFAKLIDNSISQRLESFNIECQALPEFVLGDYDGGVVNGHDACTDQKWFYK